MNVKRNVTLDSPNGLKCLEPVNNYDNANVNMKFINNLEVDSSKGLKCLYTNTDVLHNKMDELQMYINSENIDIVSITETLSKTSNEDYTPIFVINGFNCMQNNDGRGTAIFIRDTLECTRLTHYENIFSPCTICKVKVNNDNSFIFGVIYRSPNSEDNDNLKLNEMITQICNNNSREKIVLTGDFNYPDINWAHDYCDKSVNNKASKFLECIHKNYLNQLINESTHHRGTQTPTLVDLLLTNESDFVYDVNLHAPLGKSHHSVICFNIDSCNVNKTKEPVVKFNMNKGNYDQMRKHLSKSNESWDMLMDNNLSLDEWCSTIVGTMEEAKELFIPKKCMNSNRPKRSFAAPESLLAALRLKRKAFKAYKRLRTPKNQEEYVYYRNMVNKLVKKAKRSKELKIAKESKLNPKVLFQYIASQNKPRDTIPDLDKPDGTQTANDGDKVNVLSDFFKSVYTLEGDSPVPHFEANVKNYVTTSVNINKCDVLLALKSLNVNKSPGPDKVHPRILRECANELAYPIHKLFVRSMKEGRVPSKWKEAEVRPIFKKGKKSSPGNYRPVSLTSLLCKLMEGLVRATMYAHMIDNELLSPHQFGFCKGRSCLTQLLVTINEWMYNLDNGVPVDAAYLDFRKAFDSVPHKRLLCKLKGYGIDGNLLKWIEDFLSDRTQYVAINGISSDGVPVTSGVPQGSVLGPTLFIYYINDLPTVSDTPTTIFADDTKSHNTIESQDDQIKLQTCINSMVDWSILWLLGFNGEKCKMMHLGKNNPHYTYTINDGNLVRNMETTNCEKDLGVHVDPLLEFNEHISKVVKKSRGIAGMIFKSISSRTSDILVPLFIALVRPNLEYANPVWSPFKRKFIDHIEKVQRQFTKKIYGLHKLSYEERLRELDLPSLEFRRIRGDMIETYKILTNIYDPITTKSLLTVNKASTRSHSLKILKPRFNTNSFKYFFTNRVVNTWNSLPMDIVKAESVNSFKNRLDKHWGALKYCTNFMKE